MKIEVVSGDIIAIANKVDVIVNAANSSLSGGSGVNGAVHSAAGPGLSAECSALPAGANGRCPAGEVRVTGAYQLPCKKVIHTVGPIYSDGKHGEDKLLAQCYTKSLECAGAHGFFSIAFPNISTGVYGYPKEEAAKIALTAIRAVLPSISTINHIIFVCHDEENFAIYKKLIK